ncbi:hypothetical protein [Aestuariibacter salexigens]|uniref:hypothetical protein n=1 Tax=Aestuariibacter salexigens TaxID=226010 RepID=UPI000413B0AF|nr:hypothetical protein [Aestuariibacter salexigens]
MQPEEFLAYIRQEIRASFINARQRKVDDKHKYRTEGLIQAAKLLLGVSKDELQDLVEREHMAVFGESIAERKVRKDELRALKELDEDEYYDIPAIIRK